MIVALLLVLAGLLAVSPAAAGVEVPPVQPRGDFNGDGYVDLAVGVPNEEVGGVFYAGAVNVLYGGPDGLGVEGNQLFDQSGDVYGEPQTGALFGSALAVGDFDGDGFSDLAVGAPGYSDLPALREAGLVVVLHGSADGLAAEEGAVLLFFSRGARFGATLAAGRLDADAYDDLAVGAPRWTSSRARDIPEVGGVSVFYGSRFGLGRRQWWHQATPGVAESPEAEDWFGSALAAGDFDGDLADDLAIGAPGERVGRRSARDSAGAVHVLYGTPEGLSARGSQLLSQANAGGGTRAETGDRFGSTLAAGDFDLLSGDDLAVGSPGETDDRCPRSCPHAGAVHVLYGSDGGLRAASSRLFRPPWENRPAEFELGAGLAAGDFDHDLVDDLAIGAPGWRPGEGRPVGAVRLVFGEPGQGLPAAVGFDLAAPSDQVATGFGRDLAAGDFDGDAADDLAVGAAAFDVDLIHGVIVAEDAGAVDVLYGEQSVRPIPAARLQEWAQGRTSTADLLGTSERDDAFGAALALPWWP